MGQIKAEVRDIHISYYKEEKWIKPFLNGFDVTWARRRKAHNTELSMYFLKPEAFISHMFGFEHEIVLYISDFSTIEPRTMQAADALIGDDPAKGRVDQSIFFLVSPAYGGQEWVADYTSRNPQSRIPVVFNTSDLENKSHDEWLIRNILQNQLFSRDLFDYKLPLDNDLFFFGRDQIIADHLDAIRRSQNRGLFGLRKTGKTSILYKIGRIMQRDNLGSFLYYDCKLPSIRMLKWNELLFRIAKDIINTYKLGISRIDKNPSKISDDFIYILQQTPRSTSIALVFDEIEYISPIAIDDIHWKKDFIPFWQTLWSAQSQIRRLANIIVGVNPHIVETDTIDGIQNPMFGVIQPRYIHGLSPEEMRGMVRFFGRRMGLSFTMEAYDYLHKRYGGHPLLTRMACSEIHAINIHKQRPIEIDKNSLFTGEEDRDAELIFYCRHVVSELKNFYKDEYELLEMLASNQIVDVIEFIDYPEFTRHLKEYGLLHVDGKKKPTIAIPVIGKFIGNELARKEHRHLLKRIIPTKERERWIHKRRDGIIRELRDLCKIIKEKELLDIFGINSFPEADKFLSIKCVSNEDEFVAFINTCNRCFVEAVERFGKNQNKSDFFWRDFKQHYPELFDSFYRIKIYRHDHMHLELNEATNSELKRFLDIDFEGKRFSQVQDAWFVLQQCVLDGLFLGIQYELNRID